MKDTDPKPFVFVLMPFSNDFRDIYEVGIKQACKDAGAFCERVDEQIFHESILDRVYNQIAKADVIVSEMTRRNPNVFYETGYAHALNKRVILLTQKAEDIPFDLKHYPHIVYEGNITKLRTELETRIAWCIDNPKNPIPTLADEIELFFAGVLLSGNPEIKLEATIFEQQVYFPAKLAVHNLSNKVVDASHFDFTLFTSEPLRLHNSGATPLPNGQYFLNRKLTQSLFPDGWHSVDFDFFIKAAAIKQGPFYVALRLSSSLGRVEYPFQLRLHVIE